MKHNPIITAFDNLDIRLIDVSEVAVIYTPRELKELLEVCALCSDTDIMLDNMIEYFIEEELYEHACVIRDEIIYRSDFK